MGIYKMTSDEVVALEKTTFREANIKERADLQRLLRDRIEAIAPGCMVIAEEFGEWDESRRRIDLLAIDTEANLVVIELKRTEDGGHMELQAIRYAAMVSMMTFDQAVAAHRKYLNSSEDGDDPAAAILGFLGWDEPDEEAFGQDVRVVLASAEFSRELTTAVLWLNDRGLDIRCVRLIPYTDGTQVLLDIQRIIPLPEAEAYQTGVREKARKGREARRSNRDYTKYDVTLGGEPHASLSKREAVYRVVRHLCERGTTPNEICDRVSFRKANAFRSVEGSVTTEREFIERATKDSTATGRKFDTRRWYTADDKLIRSDGRTYALTNQWGGRAFEWIHHLLSKYPDHEVSVEPSIGERSDPAGSEMT